jgi:hypothetical protein
MALLNMGKNLPSNGFIKASLAIVAQAPAVAVYPIVNQTEPRWFDFF